MHVNDIKDVVITDDGYLVNGTTLVAEDDIALMIYLENNGIVHELESQEQAQEKIHQQLIQEVNKSANQGLFRRGVLGIVQQEADAFGLGSEVATVFKYGSTYFELWKNDGDTLKLETSLNSLTGTRVRNALDTIVSENITVSQQLISRILELLQQ